MLPFQQLLFQLFGNYEKAIDSYKDVDGKGLEERFQETIGESIDTELMGLIQQFLPNTIEARTILAELLPYAERMLGYDTINQTLRLGTSVDWRRRVLEGMVKYYHIKGTKRCYEILFAIMGLVVEIEEFWPDPSFDDPDLILDTDDRPILDLGPCTPCSRYSLTLIGDYDYDDIAAGIASIIAFNEPINAYQGILTFNGQEFTPGGGLEGAPCPLVYRSVDLTPSTDTFTLTIGLDASQPGGFTAGSFSYAVNGGVPVTGSGPSPGGSVVIGPFDSGDVVVWKFFDAVRPLCASYDTITWTQPCTIPSEVLVETAGSMLRVTIPDSALPLPAGFTTDSIRYSLNGEAQIETPFTAGDGGATLIGPFPLDGMIKIWINNTYNEACNYYAGEFPVEEPVFIAKDFNNSVWEVRTVSGGSLICGGSFTTYGGVSSPRIAKINPDGTINTTFATNVGTGFNSGVLGVEIQADGKILCCGYFSAFNGVTTNYIARLNADGTLDTSFNSGGAGFTIVGGGYGQDMTVMNDGSIAIVGAFYSYNGVAISRIVVLLPNGQINTSFDVGTGFDSTAQETCLDYDGNLLVGGAFTTYKGVACPRVIRLFPDGTRDTSLAFGVLANYLQDLKALPDGSILVIGSFNTYAGVPVPRAIRVSHTGALDTVFNTNMGSVLSSTMQDISFTNDGRIFMLGYQFAVRNPNGTAFPQSYLGSGANNNIMDITFNAAQTKATIVGWFTTINGLPALRIFQFDI